MTAGSEEPVRRTDEPAPRVTDAPQGRTCWARLMARLGRAGGGAPTTAQESDHAASPDSAAGNDRAADDAAGEEDDRGAFPGELAVYRHVGAKPPAYSPEPSAALDARSDVDGALIPDSVVDGFTAGSLTVRAASVAGDAHRHQGEPRQDAVAAVLVGPPERGLVMGVVADGVGSEPRSHVGAAAACRAAVASLARRAAALEAAIRDLQQDRLYFEVVHLIDEVTRSIEAEAVRISRPPGELATTIRAVVIPTDSTLRGRLAFSVGDGATLRLSDTTWIGIRQQESTGSVVHDTATAVLPLHPDQLLVDIWSADLGETIVICTDGLSEPLRDRQFAELLAAEWNGATIPGTLRFLWQTQSRLRSYDDDRTVICIWDEPGTTSRPESPPAPTSS